MNNKALKYFISTAVLILVFAAYQYVEAPGYIAAEHDIELSEARIEHILYGDGRGGGHRHGVGVPCKSEFPADWDADRILAVTRKIAANDNLPWRREDNGYYVSEYLEDGVKVRVVLGPERKRVITSYPTNLPRNPCPDLGPVNDP